METIEASAAEDSAPSAFLLIAEVEMKKKALEEAKSRLGDALEENERLMLEREAIEKENYAVTEIMRKELQEKNAAIEETETLQQKIRNECSKEMTIVTERCADEVRRVTDEAAHKERQLREKISALESELRSVQEFRERQNEIEQIIFAFQSEKKTIQESAAEEKAALEQDFFERSQRLKRDHDHNLKEYRIATEKAYDRCLDDRVKQILADNRRMAIELSLHKHETTQLRREVRQLETERRRLGEEVQFRNDLEDGYAKRGAQQEMRLKAMQSRSSSLEKSLQHLLTETSKQLNECRRKYERQLEDAQLETTALKKLVIQKSRENGTLRRVAQEVLLQRNDVEKFLLSSIYMVRKEQKQELSSTSGERRESIGDAKIEDMSWSDREKILRILLSRIDWKRNLSATKEKFSGQSSQQGPTEPT